MLELMLGCVGAVLFALAYGVIVVRENEAVVVEYFGKFSRVLPSGLHFLPLETLKTVNWKFADSERPHSIAGFRIPLGVQIFNPKPYTLSTRDNLKLTVDLLVRFKILEVRKAVYEMNNPLLNFESELKTHMVNVVRNLQMSQVTVPSLADGLNLETINEKLRGIGMCITAISVENIQVPTVITDTLLQTNSERIKQEALTENLLSEEKQLVVQTQVNRQKAQAKTVEIIEKHNSELKMQRETEELKEALYMEHRRQKHALHLQEAELFSKYPEYAHYRTTRLIADSWAKVASGAGTRLIVAPESALNSLAQLPVLKVTNLE